MHIPVLALSALRLSSSLQILLLLLEQRWRWGLLFWKRKNIGQWFMNIIHEGTISSVGLPGNIWNLDIFIRDNSPGHDSNWMDLHGVRGQHQWQQHLHTSAQLCHKRQITNVKHELVFHHCHSIICRQSRILFLVYHAVTWGLGWIYLYIWMCARSLFIRISPVTSVHILPGEYNNDNDKYRNTRF